jgi:hypothetical protein
MRKIASHRVPKSARNAAERIPRRLTLLGCVVGFGLALGACSKCDVPTWLPNQPGQAPHVCHDTPSPQ